MKLIPLYEAIVKFYPIGLKYTDPRYDQFSGRKIYNEIIGQRKDYRDEISISGLINAIHKDRKDILRVEEISAMDDPCYSFSFMLHEDVGINFICRTEMHLHVSLLAEVYTLFGVYNCERADSSIDFDPILCVSPMNEFSEWYDYLHEKVADFLGSYKFLPYSLSSRRLEGLSIPNTDTMENVPDSIFQALFLPIDFPRFKTLGDKFYDV